MLTKKRAINAEKVKFKRESAGTRAGALTARH